MTFRSLRDRLQRSVDRMLHGRRDDPTAVMSAVSWRHDRPSEPEAMLADIVETLARTLALPSAAIELESDRAPGWECGREAGTPIAVPLNYGGQRVGSLLVAPRTIRGRLTRRVRKLLEYLSYQVALTAHAVQLARALRRSREQLVAAREDERRRLRRDLHDGLGPTLAAITMELDAARNLVARDREAAQGLLWDVRDQTQNAITDIRRLVYGLRPPTRDELGLVGAIRDSTEQFAMADERGPEVALQVPDELPSLSSAVEVAALRIVQEAVANAASHSGARNLHCQRDGRGAVEIAVEDDGHGIEPGSRAGVDCDRCKSPRRRSAACASSPPLLAPAPMSMPGCHS